MGVSALSGVSLKVVDEGGGGGGGRGGLRYDRA